MSYKKSLFKKLLLAFLVVGFIPFILLYIYTIYWAEDKLVNKIINEQAIQAQIIIENISSSLTSLKKEIRFISQLDMMDDIIAEDLDKRISRLLTQKKDDIGLDVELYVLNNNSIIISSSDKTVLNKKLIMSDKNLYISSKIYASFNKSKKLGSLILKYNFKNLDIFFRHQPAIYNAIIDKNAKNITGQALPFSIKIDSDFKKYINNQQLVVYKKLNAPLENFYFVYAVNKDLALDFLHEFLYFMLLILPIVIFIIFFIAIYRSKKIILPIETLTKTTEEITKTKNYSTSIDIEAKDEIGRLAHAFNALLQETNQALQSLELENKLRLKRFTKLIEIFNTIIKTKSEDECIRTSIQEIKELTEGNKLLFTKENLHSDNAIPIYVSDFVKGEKVLFGSILLELHDKNENQFYHSIVSMISLQLDKIRLIDKMMSESHAKSAFISNMSHELRTPLNSMLGFTQYLLAYEDLKENQQDIISNIEDSAQYLLEMINGILDIAKIEAGMLDIHISHIKIYELLDNIVSMLLPLAQQKSIDINIQKSEANSIEIDSDSKFIQQIIINIISNAIKFTKEGGIDIFLREDENNLYIHVKDTGIGIQKQNIEKLFHEFTQIDNVLQNKHKGTGLGLSISKKLAKLLGGDIILKSEGLDKGSEAIFFIPIKYEDSTKKL